MSIHKQMGKKKGKSSSYEIEKYSRIVTELNLTIQHVVSSAMIIMFINSIY